MTVFYAYCHPSNHQDHCRIAMVFANRSVADEWWRAISESSLATHLRRINAQYYLGNYPEYNILDFFVAEHFKSISDPFRGRLFIALFDDRFGPPGARYLPIIPNQDYVDHCSGNWFYIRSKSNPSLYWYLLKGRVHVSTALTERTQFQICGRHLTTGTIMIGRDTVTFQADGDEFIYLDESGSLVDSGIIASFRFDDLEKGSFWIQRENGSLRFDPHKKPAQHSWELV